MIDADIYIAAAERIFYRVDTFSCSAISMPGTKARKLYERTINPDQKLNSYDFAAYLEEQFGFEDEENIRNFRVWLLCMMAACCQDMEDD